MCSIFEANTFCYIYSGRFRSTRSFLHEYLRLRIAQSFLHWYAYPIASQDTIRLFWYVFRHLSLLEWFLFWICTQICPKEHWEFWWRRRGDRNSMTWLCSFRRQQLCMGARDRSKIVFARYSTTGTLYRACLCLLSASWSYDQSGHTTKNGR